ncbi:MAG: LLM class flavin-dependent oxidoreductase [Catenulispora sp.]|nr:LLM class flavin-dependent oxidoreductase [Catenulispora sp.]
MTLLEFLDLSVDRPASDKRGLAVESAVRAEESGYQRLWIAEHHGRAAPCGSPLPVAAALGAMALRLRIGTAVTLLRLRDPYLTALDIAQASHFCSGGFDVGLGRGDVRGPAEGAVAHLRKDDEQLAADLDALAAMLREGGEALPPLAGNWQLWLHGSATTSAELAAKLGANYCHALFFNPDIEQCRAAFRRYRELGGQGATAIAVAFAAGQPGKTTDEDATRRWGVRVSMLPDADMCARTALRALAISGAQELVIAELSPDPAQHLDRITEIRSSLLKQAG